MKSIKITLTHPNIILKGKIAQSIEEHSQGMKGKAFSDDMECMLFLFKHPTTNGFWMKDTKTAITIAFFDEEGCFVSKHNMTPFSQDVIAPKNPYLLALEMPWRGKLSGRIGCGTKIVEINDA